MRRLPAVLFVLFVLFAGAAAAQGSLVAAAANVKYALDDIVAAFGRDTGHTLRVSYGGTGNLAQQIENGAPFELFVAADEAAIERLAAAGYARDGGVVYAVGRLALFVPRGSTLAIDGTLADLKAAVADGRLKRFAIASPEHAPYGRAARQALERAGVWESIRARLVLGESVAQAMQFAAAGDAQGGLVPLALASAPALRTRGSYVAIPDAMHAPLRQRMALMQRAGAAAIAFEAYLRGPVARDILVRHGYAVP
jgi:molybdate transport system substrate-binding protein